MNVDICGSPTDRLLFFICNELTQLTNHNSDSLIQVFLYHLLLLIRTCTETACFKMDKGVLFWCFYTERNRNVNCFDR